MTTTHTTREDRAAEQAMIRTHGLHYREVAERATREHAGRTVVDSPYTTQRPRVAPIEHESVQSVERALDIMRKAASTYAVTTGADLESVWGLCLALARQAHTAPSDYAALLLARRAIATYEAANA